MQGSTCPTTHNYPLVTGPVHSYVISTPLPPPPTKELTALLPSRCWNLFKHAEAFPILPGTHLLLGQDCTCGQNALPRSTTSQHNFFSSASGLNLQSLACKLHTLPLSHNAPHGKQQCTDYPYLYMYSNSAQTATHTCTAAVCRLYMYSGIIHKKVKKIPSKSWLWNGSTTCNVPVTFSSFWVHSSNCYTYIWLWSEQRE